jgi:hypothetical protein
MQIQLATNQLYLPDYDGEKARCLDFITTFQDPKLKPDSIHGKLKYMIELQRVANRESTVINIELDDIKEFFSAARDASFVDRTLLNTARYVDLFS